jgi:uncharacterized damage-inducible protein DinB
MPELNALANAIEEAITGPVWHGPSLGELLDTIVAADAAAYPIPTAHSIWELVLHMTSWAGLVQGRLALATPLLEPTDAEDWPTQPATPSSDEWQRATKELTAAYRRLGAEVRTLSVETLVKRVPSRQHSVKVMLQGVVEHAAYHGGQIALLRRAVNVGRVGA